MDRTTGQQDQLGKEDMNSTISQLDLTDIYGTLHSTKEDYTYFSGECRTLSSTDDMLDQNTSLSKFKTIKIIQNIFSDHIGIKLEINTRRKTGKFTNKWKLYFMLFNNKWDKKKSQEKLENWKIHKYVEINMLLSNQWVKGKNQMGSQKIA